VAGHLNRFLWILFLLPAPCGLAQALGDPMRPPRDLSVADVGPAEPGLSPAQVVIISKDRSQATINGRTVPLGGRYGDATLVGISDEEIVLQRQNSTEVIRLYSSVERRMRPSSERRANAAQKRED
jgi:MSHA biogenesis protein MshK